MVEPSSMEVEMDLITFSVSVVSFCFYGTETHFMKL